MEYRDLYKAEGELSILLFREKVIIPLDTSVQLVFPVININIYYRLNL